MQDDASQPTSAGGAHSREVECLKAELTEKAAEIGFLKKRRVLRPPLDIRYAMIDAGGTRLSVSRLCKLLEACASQTRMSVNILKLISNRGFSPLLAEENQPRNKIDRNRHSRCEQCGNDYDDANDRDLDVPSISDSCTNTA